MPASNALGEVVRYKFVIEDIAVFFKTHKKCEKLSNLAKNGQYQGNLFYYWFNFEIKFHCGSSEEPIGCLGWHWLHNTIITRLYFVIRAVLLSCRTDSSISHSRSPTFNTRSSSALHFGRTFHLGGHSFVRLFQIIWFSAWASLYTLRPTTYLTEPGTSDSAKTSRHKRKWFDFDGSRSLGSSSHVPMGWRLKFFQANTYWLSTLATSDVDCQ